MTVALASCSLLLLGTVVLLIREVRLRRALQQLLFRLLNLWRSLHAKDRPRLPAIGTLLTILALITFGCSSGDERLVELSRQSADRQGEQNRLVETNNRQVLEATNKLVEADAKSRSENIELHRQIEAERSGVNQQRDVLEQERRQIAQERNLDPIVADSILAVERAGERRTEDRDSQATRQENYARRPRPSGSAERKVADHNQRVEKWTENVLDASPDVKDLLSAELSGLRKERDRLADELAALQRTTGKPSKASDLDADVERIVGQLWTLADDLQRAKPARLREVLHRMLESIDLSFDHIPRGKQTLCPLSNGVLHLRPDQTVFRLVNRGDRI